LIVNVIIVNVIILDVITVSVIIVNVLIVNVMIVNVMIVNVIILDVITVSVIIPLILPNWHLLTKSKIMFNILIYFYYLRKVPAYCYYSDNIIVSLLSQIDNIKLFLPWVLKQMILYEIT
jgi:hypothetical protein